MLTGCGLNPQRKDEGVCTGSFFATYLIGPILPLNPDFTDYLLQKMLGDEFVPCELPFERLAYEKRLSELLKKNKE